MDEHTFKRYEKKYLVSEESLRKLLPVIEQYMVPDKYCVDGNRYGIYNIYYDDENGSVIRHSLSKPYYKEKLRMRCYTPFDNPDNTVFLELKKKIGGIVSKRRATMTLAQADEFLKNGNKPNLDSYIDNQVCNEIACFMSRYKIKPAAHISYSRIAYYGKDDEDFRLTFDTKIQARNKGMFSADSSENVDLLGCGQYIMEIKILGSVPMWLARAMTELDIRKVRFSKYGYFFGRYVLPEYNGNAQTAELYLS